MKRILPAVLLLCSVLPSAARRKADTSIGLKWLDAGFGVYDVIQKRIHDYAEPGYREVRSSKELAGHLAENGFSIEWGVAGIPTAFVATFGQGSPVVGLLGEYDALPGMSQDTSAFKHPLHEGACGHACGHNLLGTATAASAVAISKWLSEGHQGTVKYFGCPAEEGGGGKYYMTTAGCFDGCDAVFDWHPAQRNVVSLSPWQANMRVNFTFSGVSSHAGGAPWNGRSALDAVEAFDYMMNLMREHVPDHTRIHYVISNGGQAPNVVPDRAQVVYYFRQNDAKVLQDVFQRALKAAEGAALGTGTTMSYEVVNACYERLINRRLAELFLKNLKLVGGVKLDDREKAYIGEILKVSGAQDCQDCSNFETVPDAVEQPIQMGLSSDVGNVSQVVPLATLRVATAPAGAGGEHSWQQAAVGGTTIGTKSLLTVARVFYLTALDLYTSPDEVKSIRDEYESARGTDYKFVPLMDRRPPLDLHKDTIVK